METIQTLRDYYYDNEVTYHEIAYSLGLSVSTVLNAIKHDVYTERTRRKIHKFLITKNKGHTKTIVIVLKP